MKIPALFRLPLTPAGCADGQGIVSFIRLCYLVVGIYHQGDLIGCSG